MESRTLGTRRSCVQDAATLPTLALLTRQRLLIAVTLQAEVAERQFDITISKALDEGGQCPRQYWWDVDRLTQDGMGSLVREKRWAQGLHPYATPDAAYQAAVEAIAKA